MAVQEIGKETISLRTSEGNEIKEVVCIKCHETADARECVYLMGTQCHEYVCQKCAWQHQGGASKLAFRAAKSVEEKNTLLDNGWIINLREEES